MDSRTINGMRPISFQVQTCEPVHSVDMGGFLAVTTTALEDMAVASGSFHTAHRHHRHLFHLVFRFLDFRSVQGHQVHQVPRDLQDLSVAAEEVLQFLERIDAGSLHRVGPLAEVCP